MTLSKNELDDNQKAGIEMLIDIMTTGYKIDITDEDAPHADFEMVPRKYELVKAYPDYIEGSPDNWKGTKWAGMNRKKAREIAFDIVVGSYMDSCEEVRLAKQRWSNKRLGFEKCTHLCFNLPNDWKDDKIKEFITRFHMTTWSCLSRAVFIVEFYGKAGNYNPHIHCWMPYIAPGKIKQLATRKFGKECNVWVGNGHKNLLPYIKGVKRESKEVAVEADKLHRAEMGYDDYYEFS